MYYILNYIIVKISCQHTRRLFSIFLNYVLPLVQVWFKTAWHLPFCFKSHFCKSPQTIEKSEQFRCHLNCSLLLAPRVGLEPTTFSLRNMVALQHFRLHCSLFLPNNSSLHRPLDAVVVVPVNSRTHLAVNHIIDSLNST